LGKNARSPRAIAIAAAVALAVLAGAGPASAATVFGDGFESGGFGAWSTVQTAGDGKAAIQSAIIRTGTVAAQLSESSTAGSKAFVRKTFDAAQQDLTASGDFQVVAEGASGGNVPFFRFLDPASARVVSVYRQNATGAIGLTFADGTRATSTGKLALATWAHIALHVITAGTASTVQVSLDGTQVYSSTTQSLGNAGVSTIQIGNDTAAQAFNIVADTIDVQNAAAATPSPPINTVKPTVSGAAQVGQTLTASPGNWDGTPTITFAYQWEACNPGCSAINGATSSTHVVASGELGMTLRVVVTATNGVGSATATSNQTAAVVGASAAPVNSAPPTITGTAQSGQTLNATTGTWTGSQPMTFSYKWERCPATGACTTVGGTTSSYTLVDADVGSTIQVSVTASNSGGSATATSNRTAAVTAAPANPAGLVALWRMDETSGTTMRDAVGTHNGTTQNVQVAQPGGFSGLAYKFAGSSQVLVPNAADLNAGAAKLTVTIHMKATAVPATPDWDLIRKGVFTSAGGEFKVEYQPSGQATCGFNTSTNYLELTAGPALNNNQWHTVQCVKTSTGIQLVVDGQTFSKAGALGTIGNTVQVVLGAHPGSEFFQGFLDEASIQIG
jgi:concanavalin A-like lectin/glucanase superfamily protein